MLVYCTGTARIRHSDTGAIYDIQGEELDWDAVEANDRGMGAETHYEAVVHHPELGVLTWGLWEYPVGVENYQESNAGNHEILKDFDYGLSHGDPDLEIEWLDYTAPEDPFTIFMDSYLHTGELLAAHGTDHGGRILNRMVFSHQVTALEAYLGDTLINAFMADPAAMQRLIVGADDLASEKFTLAEISNEPRLVERKVREYLRSILYHNLAKVDVLYEKALGFRILHHANDKVRLFKAVVLRHDCVHRNGFDKDGNLLTDFTKQFVQDTADIIKDFVGSVESVVRARPPAPF